MPRHRSRDVSDADTAPIRRVSPAPDAPVGHGHGHGHGPLPPASRAVRRLLVGLLVPVAIATVAGALWLYPWGEPAATSTSSVGVPVNGHVTAAAEGPCLRPGEVRVGGPQPGERECLTVDVELTDGAGAGRTISKIMPLEPGTPRFAAGDDVVLAYSGAGPADAASYQLRDFQRGVPLLLLAGVFAVAVLLLARWRGLAALGSLGLSFAVLAGFILPAILAGESPVPVAIAGAGLIMFGALYLTHGFSVRTSVAILGTLVSLVLIGITSAIFTAAARLTGLDEGTSALLGALGQDIDPRGLLLAGVIIGALGVLDDVTVTQTSAVWELRMADPTLGWRGLYGAGLRIGRDHVGSAVNTLVMAYAGAALPVLLLASLSQAGLGSILTAQDIAQEIVRTLAGTVGIIAAVPVTTALAALIALREPARTRTG